jgi:hypothetical protein
MAILREDHPGIQVQIYHVFSGIARNPKNILEMEN